MRPAIRGPYRAEESVKSKVFLITFCGAPERSLNKSGIKSAWLAKLSTFNDICLSENRSLTVL